MIEEFHRFSDFVQGYITCLCFQEDNEAGPGEYVLRPELLRKITLDDRNKILSDCAKFRSKNNDALKKYYADGNKEREAGIDFAFSRNGHGCGFFDRSKTEDYKELQDAARKFGQFTLSQFI